MFKKIIFSLILGLVLVGCQTEKYQQSMLPEQEGTALKAEFNQEHYIWESWIFPSNKTTGR